MGIAYIKANLDLRNSELLAYFDEMYTKVVFQTFLHLTEYWLRIKESMPTDNIKFMLLCVIG